MHWAKEHIITAAERNIVKGYEDGTFRPDGKITRSEFAVILGRALNVNLDQSGLSFKAGVSPFLQLLHKERAYSGF